MATTKQLLNRLDGDNWRHNNAFSEDIETACDVLLDPYARDDERKKALSAWLTKNQPCVFGQVAAQERLFISIIDDQLLNQSDKVIREKLAYEKQHWKQWSLEAKGRHGFLLAVLSPRVHHAAPNKALKEFAEHIRELFANQTAADPVGNDMAYESLYLKNPNTGAFHRFRVILDFFASAGDKRWWQDHRFPGGIGFTFNSLGHMVRTKEWYEKNTSPVEWAVRMGMLTISNAFEHPQHGKATSLRDLNQGQPMKPMQCPFRNQTTLPEAIKNKDWSTYTGYHHTDHSIRAEFFDGRETPDRSRGEFLLDFSYMAGGGTGENAELMDGVIVTQAEVEKDIGAVNDWRFAAPKGKSAGFKKGLSRPIKHDRKIKAALRKCRRWLKTPIVT